VTPIVSKAVPFKNAADSLIFSRSHSGSLATASRAIPELFRRRGLAYEVCDQTRSDLYLSLVPAVNSGRVRLLDLARLESQLVALERRTTRVGRDLVDHPPGGHDDVANAEAGALILAAANVNRTVAVFSIDMQGRVVMRDDAPRARAWSRTPGISAVDGMQHSTWDAAHGATGIVDAGSSIGKGR
jgi:hypothetical protein